MSASRPALHRASLRAPASAPPKFPEGFLWGTATSAHQVEGDNVHNDWWDFERRFTALGAACDFWNRFEEDLDRARDLGTNAFRFSLEWSRLEPRPGERDEAAARRYDRLIHACRERGLAPIVTLSHFTLPRWCAAGGGWLCPGTLEAWGRHVRFVAERWGDSLDTFVTVNEPNVQAGAGYVSGVFAPGRRLRPDLADRCEAALVRAHAVAYATIHETVAHRLPSARIAVGVAQHLIAWRRSRWDPLGLVLRLGARFNWGFLDALATGEVAFHHRREAVPEARGTLDFVGVNYYMGMPAHVVGALRFSGLLARPAREGTSDLGWPIDAAGFEECLVAAHRRYGKPILVTENGIADATDALRPAYLRDHVAALERAMAQGAHVTGYCHWSLLDNFEWHEGYGPRFGLYSVDYASQTRTLRESGHLYRRLIAERRPALVRP